MITTRNTFPSYPPRLYNTPRLAFFLGSDDLSQSKTSGTAVLTFKAWSAAESTTHTLVSCSNISVDFEAFPTHLFFFQTNIVLKMGGFGSVVWPFDGSYVYWLRYTLKDHGFILELMPFLWLRKEISWDCVAYAPRRLNLHRSTSILDPKQGVCLSFINRFREEWAHQALQRASTRMRALDWLRSLGVSPSHPSSSLLSDSIPVWESYETYGGTTGWSYLHL